MHKEECERRDCGHTKDGHVPACSAAFCGCGGFLDEPEAKAPPAAARFDEEESKTPILPMNAAVSWASRSLTEAELKDLKDLLSGEWDIVFGSGTLESKLIERSKLIKVDSR